MSNLVFEFDPAKRPGFSLNGGPIHSWKEWAALHKELGQELAKRMRVYPGPSTDDDCPPEGGTPVLMRMAA